MARIKKSILGKFSGSAGEMVFVIRNNKSHFRGKPKPRDPNKPKSQKTLNNEAGFAYTSSFIKKISESHLLKMIWEYSKMHGENYYGKAFSANRKRAKPLGLTLNNRISPEGIYMKTNSLTWDENYFSINYKIVRASNTILQPPFFAVSIIFLQDPHKPNKDKDFDFLSFEELVTEQFPDNQNTITFSLQDSDKVKLSEYKKGIIYLAFVSQDNGTASTEWTITDAVEINISF